VRQTNVATREAVLASIEGDARKALDALERGGGKIIAHGSQGERFAAMAKAYAALDASERARTLVIEPSRDGRDVLTADIRRELAATGVLSGPAITMESLVAKDLSRIEARDPASYAPGDTVRFLRDYAEKGVTRGVAYKIERIDGEKAAVSLKSADGSAVDWRLRQWGAGKVEVFEPKAMELQEGDRVQFTRNDREAGRINGLRGTITGIDPERQQATIALANGREQRLDLTDPRDAHLRHAYVQTAHAAQGQTADCVLIHADSRSANLVDQKMLYVALSRAKSEAIVITDDKARLIRAIHERAGEKQTAMEVSAPEATKTKSLGAGLG
jgi:plastocyanin